MNPRLILGIPYPEREESPAQALARAILEDAVTCLFRYAKGKRVKVRSEFEEVRQWFESPDDEYLYAFCSICQILGYSPSAARAEVFHTLHSDMGRVRRCYKATVSKSRGKQ